MFIMQNPNKTKDKYIKLSVYWDFPWTFSEKLLNLLWLYFQITENKDSSLNLATSMVCGSSWTRDGTCTKPAAPQGNSKLKQVFFFFSNVMTLNSEQFYTNNIFSDIAVHTGRW